MAIYSSQRINGNAVFGFSEEEAASVGGGGFLPQKSYSYRYKTDDKLDAIAPEVAQVIKSAAAANLDDAKAVQVKTALKSVGLDYKKAYQQIYTELVQEMRDEEEQIAIAIALMI